MRRWFDPRPFIAIILINAGDGIAGTLAPLYLDSQGVPVATIGLLVAINGVTSLISRLPAGMLYRRRRARTLMYLSIALLVVSIALYALPFNLWVFGLVRALHGFAGGMATTVNMAMYMDSLAPGGDRHRHLAGYASTLSAGYMVGGVGGGLLGYWLDYQPAFLCAAAFPVVAALCITAPARMTEDAAGPAVSPPAERPPAPSLPARLRGFADALRQPQVAKVSIVAFFLQVIHQMGQTFVPLYALNSGLNLAEIGLLRSTHSGANTVARPFGGEITRWLGYDRVATLGMLLIVGLLMLTPFQSTLLGWAILFAGVGVGRAAVLVANTVSVADIQTGVMSRGMAVGVYSAARDLGGIVGPVAGGYIAAAVGLRTSFWVGPLAVLGLYAFLLWLASRGSDNLGPSAPSGVRSPGVGRAR
jgi:DHA1 family multidrug resistance protein-like MFS transporter